MSKLSVCNRAAKHSFSFVPHFIVGVKVHYFLC